MTKFAQPVRRIILVVAVLAGMLALPSTATAATPPVAPSGLTATFTAGVITLNWVDNDNDETGYSIERCVVADCSAAGQIASVGADVTSYADPFFSAGSNRYRVRAFNSAGLSDFSNRADLVLFSTGEVNPVIVATPLSGQAPLTVAFDGSGSTSRNGTVTAWAWSFGDNQAASGAIVSHTYTTAGVYAASLKATVTGGPFGATAASRSVLITVTAPLAAPSDLTATSPSRGRVDLAWTNPTTSATTLVVQRCRGTACTSFAAIGTVPITATGYVDTTVNRRITYSYRLAASNATGTVYSNRVTVTVQR